MANVLGELFQSIADAIRSKTGSTDTLKPNQFPAAIEGITTGGGTSPDVRYVTFMNGTEVLYKKPVAVGDDCVDVVAKGLISTPTKASTVQYNYTFYGWGASDGGAADANILKNITADKTVYAIFTATARLYTITWLDSDGATVLKTEQVAYGKIPSYVPLKDGVVFAGWTPEPVAVTGDASYIVTWEDGNLVLLETTSVKTTSQSGTSPFGKVVATVGVDFVMGDTYLVYWNGTEYTLTAQTYFFNNANGGTTLRGIGNPHQVTKIASKTVTDWRIGSSSGAQAPDTGEPFLITYNSYDNSYSIRTSSADVTANVRIEKPM